eukprot:scaffold242237_cov39-Prasinocladus_malaysianus.AAC.2
MPSRQADMLMTALMAGWFGRRYASAMYHHPRQKPTMTGETTIVHMMRPAGLSILGPTSCERWLR